MIIGGINVKKNNWILYLVYAVLLICFLSFSYVILGFLNRIARTTFNFLPFILVSTIIYIVLGLLLGLDKLLLEKKKEGKWRMNLPRAILLGIPLLYLSLGEIIFSYCPILFNNQILGYPLQFFFGTINFFPIFQIILGYIMCTIFIKRKE